jgi:hypothetical protein
MEITMSRTALTSALALAAALIAGSAFVTTAEAGGCHHGFGGGFGGGFTHQSFAHQSYAYEEERLYKKRRAIAKARAEERAEELAAERAAKAKFNVAKVDTAPVKVADATVLKSKKSDLETSSSTEVAAATQACRKFSPAVGGLVETPCE